MYLKLTFNTPINNHKHQTKPQTKIKHAYTLSHVSDVATIVHPRMCGDNIFGKYREARNSLSLSSEKRNGSRHLVFWSLGTLTGLRDWVRGLVA